MFFSVKSGKVKKSVAGKNPKEAAINFIREYGKLNISQLVIVGDLKDGVVFDANELKCLHKNLK